jgi:hypothetical protein
VVALAMLAGAALLRLFGPRSHTCKSDQTAHETTPKAPPASTRHEEQHASSCPPSLSPEAARARRC